MNEIFPENLKKQLKLICCPLLGNYDDLWLRELIFSESENHYEFLRWIFFSLDQTIKTLDKDTFSVLSNEEKIKHLHFICSCLGICEKSDQNVIQGVATEHKIVTFWGHLLDMFISVNKNKDPTVLEDFTHTGPNIPAASFPRKPVVPALNSLNSAIDAIKNEKKWSLLPPELEHETKEFARKNALKPPTKAELKEMISSLGVKDMPDQTKELAKDQLRMEDLQASLMSSLVQLQSTASGCKECQGQIQPWLKRNTARPDGKELGDLVKQVSHKMSQFQQMLDNVLSVQTSLEDGAKDKTEERNVESESYNQTEETNKIVGVLDATLRNSRLD